MAGVASVLARNWLARALAELGEFPEGLAVARESLDINLSTDRVGGLPAAYSAIGYVQLQRGDLAEALEPLTRAVEVGKATELLNWGTMSLAFLGVRDMRAGRLSEGLALLQHAISLAEERGERFLVPLYEGWLGEAHLASGEVEEARRHAQTGLEMSRAQPQRGTEAWAWRLLGEVAAATDPPDFTEAESAYKESLTRASNLGMRPLVAHCHLGLGKLYRRAGDRAKAEEHLASTITMYREMGMRFWLEQAEVDLDRPRPG
jgi:tetratricopeptide (TPR) repeat protein